MHHVLDPLLSLQRLGVAKTVVTLPETSKPFELTDGNTYLEHAGMAVEVDRLRSFKTVF